MHRSATLAVPLVLAALAVPATAAPVSTTRIAVADLVVPASGGDRWEVELRASSGRLDVTVARCSDSCRPARRFAGPLAPDALDLDPQAARARLDAVVGGLALQVTWTPDLGTGVVIGGLRAGGRGEDVGVDTYRGDPAVTRVTVAGGSCGGVGSVGDEVAVATSDAGDPTVQPLSRLQLHTAGTPTCVE